MDTALSQWSGVKQVGNIEGKAHLHAKDIIGRYRKGRTINSTIKANRNFLILR